MRSRFLERLIQKYAVRHSGSVQQPYKNKALGRVLLFVAIAVTLVLAGATLYIFPYVHNELYKIAVAIVLAVVIIPTYFLADIGISLLSDRGDDILQKNRDNFGLWLRSFEDEEKDGFTNTFERKIIHLFDNSFPIISVGRPGEVLETPGAHRLYYYNDDWKENVLELIHKAKVIIVRLGSSTQGLLWEIRQAVLDNNPDRLVLVLPLIGDYSDVTLYNESARHLREVFGLSLPEFPMQQKRMLFIVFDAAGTPAVWQPSGVYAQLESLLDYIPSQRSLPEYLYLFLIIKPLRKKFDGRIRWSYYLLKTDFLLAMTHGLQIVVGILLLVIILLWFLLGQWVV